MRRVRIPAAVALLCAAVLTGCSSPTGSDSSGGNGDSGSPPEADTTLVITEVGSAPYVNISAWFEVYNDGSDAVDLGDLTLRTTFRDRVSPYEDMGEKAMNLPSLSIPPGGYALIRGQVSDDYVSTGRVVYVKTSSGYVPNWYSGSGFIELLSDGRTVDFVRFGDSSASPTSDSAWGDAEAPLLPSVDENYGYAIARDASNTDSNTSGDWTLRDFATPGGPNDVTTTTDDDNDGIPDANETEGSTFAGLPLYEWGARQGTPDAFIHINYMDSDDAGVIPRQAALDAVVAAFDAQGINLHLDVGDLYDTASGTDPSDYDLSDRSHRVPFNQAIDFRDREGYANVYEYKYQHMPIARKQIFHYALFGYSQNADGSAGPSGRGEIYGNDFIVTLGGIGLTATGTDEERNLLENFQASTFMHEFGHNLGLGHGGNEDQNYKPNYFSIMNYLYQLRMLPDIGTDEGDRYYLEYGLDSNYQELDDLHKNPYNNSPSNVNMDFSHGDGADIDETAVSEAEGLGQPGSSDVDYDGDGTYETGIEYNVNSKWSDKISTISDYDDWANIELFFGRTYYGDSTGVQIQSSDDESSTIYEDPVWDDHQQIYPEETPTEIIEWLDRRE